MIKKAAKIVNKLGLHARPSAMLVTVASKYESQVFVTKDGLRVNAKSIMGVMMLAAEQGAEIIVEADGVDEQAALEEILSVIESGFGENE
ncbi:MAG: HPr family phosphocarrier protein [Candidatus Zixiibacteriota bacterium]|nr:MAG: HPr family phosphocarrier protein [candidate division Zixibacteria bacterium]